MTNRQKKKLAMYEMVLEACDRRRFEWQNLPAFAKAHQDFLQHVKNLRALTNQQCRHTGGLAQTKTQARHRLCQVAYEISAATRAANLGVEKTSFSLTVLRTGKDALCLQRCRKILASATGQLARLEDYGITKAKLEGLEEAIAHFTTFFPQLREIREANKKITAGIPAEFQGADEVLYHRLDNLIPQFRTDSPRFFADFTASRLMRATKPESREEPVEEETPLLD